MSKDKERPPEPLDFFIWTVEDVGLWLEEINLGSYRQVFKENGVNGEYLEGMSMFTTEQILRELNVMLLVPLSLEMEMNTIFHLLDSSCSCIFLSDTKSQILTDSESCISGLLERGAKGTTTLVGSVLSFGCICQGSETQQAVSSCVVEAGTLM
ncbi:hypothetical protein Sango_1242700 [Sesamum angolense]|uniref:SAM domain-containing protein n=1 Tax=Sesamum angolense TaxID=2727404 RepID=A0AAE1WQA2_9LAMI|nr:hypothetical protein Sango_1242700 [Sesamum angolense]